MTTQTPAATPEAIERLSDEDWQECEAVHRAAYEAQVRLVAAHADYERAVVARAAVWERIERRYGLAATDQITDGGVIARVPTAGE